LLDIWWELEHSVIHVDPEHPKHAQGVTCLVSMEELEHSVIHVDPEHPKHAQWVTCLVSMRELRSDPCDVRLCIIILKQEMMDGGLMARQRASGSRRDISAHSNTDV
jgi:hypothetical protein